MEALEIKTIFTLTLFGRAVPITETVIVSWAVMLVLMIGAFVLTRRLKEVPAGPQVFLEMGVEFLNNIAKNQLGKFANFLGPYFGSLLLFLLLSNLIGLLSPVPLTMFGLNFIPPFEIHPPTRDINVTAAFGVISISMLLICGFAARGFTGWFKNLLKPLPFMLPFNLMDFATRLLSLTLRLFGNILGATVLMSMIEGLLPVGLPAICSIYFDLFDGVVQAAIFVFLSGLYISEAIKTEEE